MTTRNKFAWIVLIAIAVPAAACSTSTPPPEDPLSASPMEEAVAEAEPVPAQPEEPQIPPRVIAEDSPGYLIKENFEKGSLLRLRQTNCEMKVAFEGPSATKHGQLYRLDATLGKAEGKPGNNAFYYIPVAQAIDSEMSLTAKVRAGVLPKDTTIHFGMFLHFPAQGNEEHFKSSYAITATGENWNQVTVNVPQEAVAFAVDREINPLGARITGIGLWVQGDFTDDRVVFEVDDVRLFSPLEERRYDYIKAFNESGVGTTSFSDENLAMPVKIFGVQADGVFRAEPVGNQLAVVPTMANIYFNVDDKIVHNSRVGAQVRVQFTDRGKGAFSLQYTSRPTRMEPFLRYRGAGLVVQLGDTNQSMEAVFDLPEAAFDNGLSGGDFRLTFQGAQPPITEVALLVPGVNKDRLYTQYRYDTLVHPILVDLKGKLLKFNVNLATAEGPDIAALRAKVVALETAAAKAQAESEKLTKLPLAQYEANKGPAAEALAQCQDLLSECDGLVTAVMTRKAGKPGVAYAMTSFETLVPPMAVPPKELSTQLAVFATPGEFEPATFAFFAANAYPKIRVRTEPLKSADGSLIPAAAIDARVMKVWLQAGPYDQYQSSPAQIPELLVKDDRVVLEGIQGLRPDVRLTGAVTTSMTAGQTKQFWLTVRVPDAAKPGRYSGKVHVTSGDKPGTILASLDFHVDVLPFILDDHGKDIGIYLQSTLTDNKKEEEMNSCEVSERLLELQLADLQEHGVTAPTCYNRTQMDTFVALFKKYGFRGPIGFMGTTDNMKALDKQFKAAGLGGLAAYIFDEPATDEAIKTSLAAAERAHKAGVLTFAAMLNERAVREIGSKLDINNWMIDSNFLPPDHFRGMKARREAGEKLHKKYWYYWQSLTEHPLTNRTFVGLYLHISGFDGICPYVYQSCPTELYHAQDRWQVYGGKTYRMHQTTYPSKNGPIPTIQWEGFREGVDDLRYITTLKNRVEKSKASPAAEAGRKLLGEIQNIPYTRVNAKGLFALRKKIADAIVAIGSAH